MRQVQQALAPTGIPCYAGAWRRTAAVPEIPATYIAYKADTHESEHYDDRCTKYWCNVYLNLYTHSDPDALIRTVIDAMRAGGFELSSVDENEYDAESGENSVMFTFGLTIEEAAAWASTSADS